MYIMALPKKLKTRDTARQTAEKNMNKGLQLTEDIDKSTTAQNDFAEIFGLRDTLVETFDKIKILDENIFNIFIDQDKSQDELDAESKNASIFSIHFKTEMPKLISYLTSFENENQDLPSRMIKTIRRK